MNTLFIGRELIEEPLLDSTNSYMAELLKKSSLLEGLVVWAKSQTQGRGQRGNTWESEVNKNLTLSIVLFPTFLNLDKQFLLNKVISLGVANFIQHYLEENGTVPKDSVKIKWPNDIYAGNKKIAGILIENTLRNNQIINSVIGIGININQVEFKSKSINPTSLQMLTTKDYDLRKCLEKLCSFIEAEYLHLKAFQFQSIDSAYKTMLYQLEQWHRYSIKGKDTNAKITGISPEGKLMLNSQEGFLEECGFKEIVFVV